MHRFGALLLLLVSACGGISVDEAVQQFAPRYCAKLKSCYDTDGETGRSSPYDAAYPRGESSCVGSFTRGLSEEQLEATSTCTDAQLDACVQKIDALQCGRSLSETAVPVECSCN